MAQKYESHETHTTLVSNINGANWKGQTFTPDTEHTITSVKLWLKRTGSPGTLTVGIRATDASLPTGGDLCSGTYNGNIVSDSGELIEITLGAGTPLSASTMYSIVTRCITGDASNKLSWYGATPSGYADGCAVSSSNSGVDWSETTNYDHDFEDWGDPIISAIGPFPTFFKP